MSKLNFETGHKMIEIKGFPVLLGQPLQFPGNSL